MMLRVILSPVLTVVGLLCVVLATLVFGSAVIVIAHFWPRSSWVTSIMRLWARVFLIATATRVHVEGVEHIDPGRSYVFSGNHISNIDIPVMISRIPVSVRFLAKQELFRVPVLGRAMRAIHMVETDRAAGPGAHRAINEQVSRVVTAGLSLVIYPEGTRSKDAEMKPFKKGAFRIAIDNGLPIVPVTITGSERVWRPGSRLILGGRVRLVIHEPIPTEGLTTADIAGLRDRLEGIVAATYRSIRVR